MDLSTRYMGLDLKHPLVASPSPISDSIDGIKKIEDGGAAAIVMHSLFEEQVEQENNVTDYLLAEGSESFGEALSYFPDYDEFQTGAETYLELLEKACSATDIPIIGSLNGVTNSGWIGYAKDMEQAGASAIELNIFSIPADLNLSGREIESNYLEVVGAVKKAVTIPVAIKLNPYFSAFGNMARQIDESGADALVLFNRFYQPDFDIETFDIKNTLNLSSSHEIRLPLLWIAILYGKLKASLASTTGVTSYVEVAKYLLAGADIVMTTSAILKNGPEQFSLIRGELMEWMERKGYESLSQVQGAMSQEKVADPSAFERANYIKILKGYRHLQD